MKAVILPGRMGTRLREETSASPKPMVEIGGKPILWHVIKIYSSFGINDFIICCGDKEYFIKEYSAKYFLHQSDDAYGDRVSDINISDSILFHKNNGKSATLAAVCPPDRFGALDIIDSQETSFKKSQKEMVI